MSILLQQEKVVGKEDIDKWVKEISIREDKEASITFWVWLKKIFCQG